jgi:hypothetical protein
MELATPSSPDPEPAVIQRIATGRLVSRELILFIVALLAAVALRFTPTATFPDVGFDEEIYRYYALNLEAAGLEGYPELVAAYTKDQARTESMAKLPPSRITYIAAGWAWKRLMYGDAPRSDIKDRNRAAQDPMLQSFHKVSALFSCLFVALAGCMAWRLFGASAGAATALLAAVSPLGIQMGQHALIDGFFAFWAMLSLALQWECMRNPGNRGLLVAYGAVLAAMVLTKENAFFAYMGLASLVLANRWIQGGKVTRGLLIAAVAGPLAAVAFLMMLAGGLMPLVEMYRVFVAKANTLTFAIETQDGPWHRYLVDYMAVSPVVLILGTAGFLRKGWSDSGSRTLTVYTVITYAAMCCVKYSMNLRFATLWELPLRTAAALQILWMGTALGPRARVAAVLLLCAHELWQYEILFVRGGLYELITGGLLRVQNILK